jgi:uncharacterized protein (TIGR02246 family)
MSDALADRFALQDVMANYAAGVDERDMERLRRCFADDVEVLGFTREPMRGAAAWLDFVARALEQFEATHHLMSLQHATIDGDRAHARTDVHAQHFLKSPAGATETIFATYETDFERIGGRFRIVRQRFVPRGRTAQRRGGDDERAIRALVETYNDAVMRFDAEAWAGTWAEEAHWSLPGLGDIEGREAIVAAWRGAMAAFECVGVFASPGSIVVEGDRAQGTWYQQEFLYPKGGGKRTVLGRYDDVYVKRRGRWLFAERRYAILKAE